jgi:hypothetical protein
MAVVDCQRSALAGSAGILPALAGILPASIMRPLSSGIYPSIAPPRRLTGWKPVRAGKMPTLDVL